jgi:hypothetical protein
MGFGRVARIGVYGTCCVALVAGSVGCSKLREQWPSRRLAREYTPPVERPVVTAPAVERDAFVSSRLEGLPVGVQTAFVREHPAAEIMSVESVPSGAGPMLYRISYVDQGRPGTASYTSGGRDTAPPQEVVQRPDDSGRPKAKFAPATEVGIPGQGTPSGAVD